MTSEEVSANRSSHELCSSPSCLRWAESFDTLLSDSEGVELFKTFLEQESCPGALDFWFACQGLKLNVDPEDTQKVHQLVKAIYRTYIRGDQNKRSMGIRPDTRRDISNRLRGSAIKPIDVTIFDDAQIQVECRLRQTLYPSFVLSDLYVQCIQRGSNAVPKMSSVSTTTAITDQSEDSTVLAPLNPGSDKISDKNGSHFSDIMCTKSNSNNSTNLPTLDENVELMLEDSVGPAPLTTANLLVTRFFRAGQSYRHRSPTEAAVSGSGNVCPPANPYHVSYTPASARDSELHSLSSGQHTDDTQSRTTESSRCDSLPSLHPSSSASRWGSSSNHQSSTSSSHRHQSHRPPNNSKSCRSFAMQQSRDQAPLIPRTQQLESTIKKHQPKRNLAEIDKGAFVNLLTSRLNIVVAEQLCRDRITRLLDQNSIEATDTNVQSALLQQPWADRLRAAALVSSDPHEDAQTILEEHCSRIWAKSAQGSPLSDTAETGSPPPAQETFLHYHYHDYHHHYKPGKSSSRRPRHQSGSAADSASICTLGVDSGISLPTVLSTASSNSLPNASQPKGSPAVSRVAVRPDSLPQQPPVVGSSNRGTGSHQTSHTSTQPFSDKVLAWIYGSSEAQRSKSSRSSSCKPSHRITTDHTFVPISETVQEKGVRTPSVITRSMSSGGDSSSTSAQSSCPEGGLVIGYYLSGDNVPFRFYWPTPSISLGQFKQLVARKSNYRFFFKQNCDDFDSGVVYAEITNDDAPLPLWEGKVVAKVVKVE